MLVLIRNKYTNHRLLFSWFVTLQTPWEGGVYKLKMEFGDFYPNFPPKCTFDPPIFHPNVHHGGYVCLSILNVEQDWRPEMSIKEILMCIRQLLAEPNLASPANLDAALVLDTNPDIYNEIIRDQAQNMKQICIDL